MKNRDINIILGEEKNKRNIILKLFIFIVFLLVTMRMGYLQVVKNEKYSYMSERNRFKAKEIPAPRGKIYDRKGRLVATNGAGYRLVYLKEREQDEEAIKEISKITGYTEEYISKRIKYGEIFPYTRENVLVDDINVELAHKIIERLSDYPYLQVQTYFKRKYLYDTVASHSIGYVKKISEKEYKRLKDEGYKQKDVIGKEGLEGKYDKELKGKEGSEFIEVNALNKLQRKIEKKVPPIPGKNLYTTLDIELQEYMEEEFKKDGRAGAFIALNPKNGEIITCVSYPTYSLNMFSSQISVEAWEAITKDKRKPLSNKVIAGEYPPGSVFKLVSAMAFLKSGVDPKVKYNDYNGIYQIGNWKWKAWKRGGHGYTDMKKSIVESANPYYYNYADKLGLKPIREAAEKFGIGKKVGIDIPGEKSGILPDNAWKKKKIGSSWYKGDTILLSIGQGYLTVTPIQIANLYMALANKGITYTPHLAKEFEDENGNKYPIKVEKNEILDYPKSYYDILEDALIATVAQDNGTTKVLRTKGMKVAAKSGSAQNAHSKETHAWVAGYFPADNPEIVFTTILEGAGGGGVVAGGMTRKFIDKYMEIKEREEKTFQDIKSENLDENENKKATTKEKNEI